MRYWYKILLFFHKTVFRKNQNEGLISNIDGASFDDINETLRGRMKVIVLNKTDNGFMAKYTDMYTEYILSFDKLGIAKKIELEYWKDMNVRFEN